MIIACSILLRVGLSPASYIALLLCSCNAPSRLMPGWRLFARTCPRVVAVVCSAALLLGPPSSSPPLPPPCAWIVGPEDGNWFWHTPSFTVCRRVIPHVLRELPRGARRPGATSLRHEAATHLLCHLWLHHAAHANSLLRKQCAPATHPATHRDPRTLGRISPSVHLAGWLANRGAARFETRALAVLFYDPATPPLLPPALTQSADILWIICMSLIGAETPSDRAITVTIALEELEEKAAMLEGDASDAPPTA